MPAPREFVRSPAICGSHASGIETSFEVPTWDVPEKPGGVTPAIVNATLLILTCLPTIDGSAPKRLVQKRWLSTATGVTPGLSSASVIVRPITAGTPSAL